MITLLAMLALGAQPHCPPVDQQKTVLFHLACDKTTISPSQPLECSVTLTSKRGNEILLAPRGFLPFDTPRWPRVRLQFEIEDGGGRRMLPPSKDARTGRYDVSVFSDRSAMLIQGGDVFGFLYDLNGADWTLPPGTSKARVRAQLEVDMLQRDPKGRWFPGVADFLERRPECAQKRVLKGKWTSDWINIEVRRPAAPRQR
jgi:hypothetical protein